MLKATRKGSGIISSIPLRFCFDNFDQIVFFRKVHKTIKYIYDGLF